MPVSDPSVLLLAKSTSDMPLVTVVATIGIEVDAFESPGQLRRARSFRLGAVRLFGRAVVLEVGRGASEGATLEAAGPTLLHVDDPSEHWVECAS